jgi:DNA helicase-2/ATP-dependent DNA helicase PcrA
MSAAGVLRASAEDMIADMQARGVDLANLLIADMGLFANPEKALKLMTLHNAKGREYEAVAMVCMNQGHIPHFSARAQAAYDEARRLFYVGVTRAKRILVIASDQADRRNPPCPFIAEAGLDGLRS